MNTSCDRKYSEVSISNPQDEYLQISDFHGIQAELWMITMSQAQLMKAPMSSLAFYDSALNSLFRRHRPSYTERSVEISLWVVPISFNGKVEQSMCSF